jgi:M3 family oligoendopeptidase
MTIQFAEITAERPTDETLARDYAALNKALDEGRREAALQDWDRLQREYETWMALVGLRFSQDTTDAAAKADREYADALNPKLTEHSVAFKRRLLADPNRAGLEALAGAHAVRLWEISVTTFEPAIVADLEQEAALTARYVELKAAAQFTINGETVNLMGLDPYVQSLDRETRHAAEKARWDYYAEHGEELNRLYDQLVKLRHSMAVKLGYDNYIPLGYRRMSRVDYTDLDVARYRQQVEQEVVPLVAKFLEERRSAAGWDKLRLWDEELADLQGNPVPAGGHDVLVANAEEMFAGMDSRLAEFYRTMRDGEFTDLKNRVGKAGGGFCTSFPNKGVPFIFANFTGTFHDIDVFTHEMGHAFQNWESRHQPRIDYLWPTLEAAEINSMTLEFLCHPHIGGMLEDGTADRYRRMHLLNSLAFLPYGVCVDHFQHEVYANPEATPAERHAMWQRLERRYMPWRDYGELKYPAKGAFWQAKAHIYLSPFYYIDYTLALCCALQYWTWSRNDYPAALESYVALCGRGGSLPFQELVRSAGLKSPFEAGALAGVIREAEKVLGIKSDHQTSPADLGTRSVSAKKHSGPG